MQPCDFARIDDAPTVLKVLVAREIADIGVSDYVLADLLDEWRASELQLAADSRVVELDERIVAYAMVRAPGTLVAVGDCTVAESYRRTRHRGLISR